MLTKQSRLEADAGKLNAEVQSFNAVVAKSKEDLEARLQRVTQLELVRISRCFINLIP